MTAHISAARVALAKELQKAIDEHTRPPSETATSRLEPVIYMAMVRDSRSYIVKVAHQVNGTYSNGWYDACAVMVRRLIETLIIECYECHKIEEKIKDSSGSYLFLKDLVEKLLSESAWTLGRKVRAVLPKLKDLGDKSAHNRRYNAHREDIDKIIADLRDTTQELLVLAKLK